MRVAVDTNVLAYAEGINDPVKREQAIDLLRRLSRQGTIIPVQVLGELFNVLVRKGGRTRAEARGSVLEWSDSFTTADTTAAAMFAATDLAETHRLSIWDSVILSAASKAGCRYLLSEDLQDGFTWGGVTVVNPFDSARHSQLAELLLQE